MEMDIIRNGRTGALVYSTFLHIEKPGFRAIVGKWNDRFLGLDFEIETDSFQFCFGTKDGYFRALPDTKAKALETRWLFSFNWLWWFYRLQISFPQSK